MKQHKIFLCQSANGKDIFFDALHSHTATHFEDAPQLRDLAIEILQHTTLTKPLETMEVDMVRVIGVTDVVTIDDNDELVYAMRKQREDQGWVPLTKSRMAQPCSLVSLNLAEQDDTSYELASAWIGELNSPPFPQMANATEESIPYWSKRAFVCGSQQIIPGSERTDYPW